MQFEITTNKETAYQIEKQCQLDEKQGFNRSYVLGNITHQNGLVSDFSTVQIKARDGKQIKPSDIFWLGHFSASR